MEEERIVAVVEVEGVVSQGVSFDGELHDQRVRTP